MDVIQGRKVCSFPGCQNLVRTKGNYKGRTRYDHLCALHHRHRYSSFYTTYQKEFNDKLHISNLVCEKCGWHESFCDRHRKDPKKGYTPDNVIILCPNCHRLETIRNGGYYRQT